MQRIELANVMATCIKYYYYETRYHNINMHASLCSCLSDCISYVIMYSAVLYIIIIIKYTFGRFEIIHNIIGCGGCIYREYNMWDLDRRYMYTHIALISTIGYRSVPS